MPKSDIGWKGSSDRTFTDLAKLFKGDTIVDLQAWLEKGYNIQISKQSSGKYRIERNTVRTENELRRDMTHINPIYPQDRSIASYGSIEAPLAAYFQGIRMGIWIALGDIGTLDEGLSINPNVRRTTE